MFSRDWQHAVIDLLPLFCTALPLFAQKPGIPVIIGPYVKFFQHMFPFNLTQTFIHRDYIWKQQGGTTPMLMTFKKVYVVDIMRREQSYVLPGSYDCILPYLKSSFQYSEATVQSWIRDLQYGIPMKTNSAAVAIDSGLKEEPERNMVVYLDRSTLSTNQTYLRRSGKVNGRSVVNQGPLLIAIKDALKPQYQLLVHACTDWIVDRDVMSRALVVIGPHGGHFTNLIFASRGTHVVEFGSGSLLRQTRNATNIQVNARWVFAGLSNALGHHHWFVEDMFAINAFRRNIHQRPKWSDKDMKVDIKQVLDTLKAIGVAQ